MSDPLGSFPVIITISVAWGEMDAFQHVNNSVYFRYFESARIAYFERLEFMEHMQATGVGPILASTQCRFRIPLTYPDTVRIGAKITDIGDDRFVMRYAVVSQRLQKLAAEGEGMIVSFDYRENRKAPLPEVIRQRIAALEATTGASPAQ
jgi:acyl-CoA thioester hydrolase